MKFELIIFSLLCALTSNSQITYLKGSNTFCPDDTIEFWAYGDTTTNWAYANDPDSIISTDWHFIDFPHSPTDYLLYSSVDTTHIQIHTGGASCYCTSFIPNRFTPDGDLFNEYFEPIVNCEHISTRLTIFNREQLVVYDEQGLNLKWDGRHPKDGHVIEDAVFPYIFSILTTEGQTITKEGYVFLGR